jgi:hypothetical protein
MGTPSAGIDQSATNRVPVAMRVAVLSYAAEVSLDVLDEDGCLLDWVIGFVFDTLEARDLDLRIVAETCSTGLTIHQDGHR